jgi:hypothetical protein
LCICECGMEKEIKQQQLRNGTTKSCGCLRKEQISKLNQFAQSQGSDSPFWKGRGEISGSKWNAFKSNATKQNRQLKFDVTIEEGWNLFLKQNRRCALSNLELEFGSNATASLDRIDSSKGYTLDNIQWVHKHINIMKWDLTQEEFIRLCYLVAQNNNSQLKQVEKFVPIEHRGQGSNEP